MTGNSTSKQTIPLREDYGSGIYRRAIRLRGDDHEVAGELSDDFHHFRVRLVHDGQRVQEVVGEDVRVPWTTCPGALQPLRRMRGAPVSRLLRELLAHTPPHEQCTHLHDLACLAAAHAARAVAGAPTAVERRYDIAIPDRVDGETRAVLKRDGNVVLAWELRDSEILRSEPVEFTGTLLGSEQYRQAVAALADDDLAEAAWVLKRAIRIGSARTIDFERMTIGTPFGSSAGSACHTFAPEQIGQSYRVYGVVRDFTDDPTAGIGDA